MKCVQFNSNGCKLNGYLFIPPTWIAPQQLPCILIVPGGHGLINKIKTKKILKDGFEKDVPISSAIDGLLDLARVFQNNGYVVFAYDSRGMGGEHSQLPKSEGKRDEQKISQEDVKAALDYLQSVRCVDNERIGAFGQSVGGVAIAYQAIEDKRLKSLILWGTPPSYAECVADKRIDLKKTGIKEGSKLLDLKEIISLIEQPVLLAGGSMDKDFFRYDEQRQNFDGLQSSSAVSMLLIKGFEHRIDACYHAFPMLTNFFVGWLKSTI